MLAIGTINVLKRKNIVAILDSLIDTHDHSAHKVCRSPDIWVDYNQLNQYKKDFPGVAVFGVWQLALFNNLITSEGWYQIDTSDKDAELTRFEKINNKFIAVETARKKGGINSNEGIHDGNRVVLDLSSPKIKTPKKPFLVPDEETDYLSHEKSSKRRKSTLFLILSIGVVFSLEFLYGYKYSTAVFETKRLTEVVEVYKEQINAQSFERLNMTPDDSSKLYKMLMVFKADNNASTLGEVEFSSPVTLRVSGTLSYQTRFLKYGQSFVRHPSGVFEVIVN